MLTPSDISNINAMLAQMDAHIKQQATARGFAYFSLGALLDRSDLKGGSYSVVKQLTSSFPYGLYTSLDGVHPNAIGHALLAFAAAKGIDARYGDLGRNSIVRATATELSLADQLEGPVVRWPGGPVARWSGGPVVRWPGGPVARWPGGTVERWNGGTVERAGAAIA